MTSTEPAERLTLRNAIAADARLLLLQQTATGEAGWRANWKRTTWVTAIPSQAHTVSGCQRSQPYLEVSAPVR